MIHNTDKNLQGEKWENQGLQDKAALKTSWAQLVRSNCCSLAGSLGFLAPPAAPWVYYFTYSLLYPQQEGCVIIWSFLDCFIPTESEGMDVFCMLYCYILAQLFKNNVLFLCSLLFIPSDRDKIHRSIQDHILPQDPLKGVSQITFFCRRISVLLIRKACS